PVPRVSSLDARVHPRLDELVFRLMKKRPEERPASAEKLRAELAVIKRIVEATEVGAQPTDPQGAPTELVSALRDAASDEQPAPRRKRWRVVAVVVALGV